MLKKLNHALLGLTLAVGTVAASVQPADAGHRYHHHHHHRGGGNFAAGVATGIIGLGVLGALASSSRASSCYEGPRRCEWRDQHCFYNRYDEWVCRGGYRSCWRPTICD